MFLTTLSFQPWKLREYYQDEITVEWDKDKYEQLIESIHADALEKQREDLKSNSSNLNEKAALSEMLGEFQKLKDGYRGARRANQQMLLKSLSVMTSKIKLHCHELQLFMQDELMPSPDLKGLAGINSDFHFQSLDNDYSIDLEHTYHSEHDPKD